MADIPIAQKTLRDEFALHAMNGLIENCSNMYQDNNTWSLKCGRCAEMAYIIADSMIEERNKTK